MMLDDAEECQLKGPIDILEPYTFVGTRLVECGGDEFVHPSRLLVRCDLVFHHCQSALLGTDRIDHSLAMLFQEASRSGALTGPWRTRSVK
jgi:hypothetical protein